MTLKTVANEVKSEDFQQTMHERWTVQCNSNDAGMQTPVQNAMPRQLHTAGNYFTIWLDKIGIFTF